MIVDRRLLDCSCLDGYMDTRYHIVDANDLHFLHIGIVGYAILAVTSS